MAPDPAVYPQSAVPRVLRSPSGFTPAGSACKSLLICRSPCRTDCTGAPTDAPVVHIAACISLLISCRAPWAARWLVGGTDAASHKSLVTINENASTCRSRSNRSGTASRWSRYRKWRAGAACNATRKQNIKPEQARRRPGAASKARSDPSRSERLNSRRPPPFIVNPGRCLLIQPPCAEPVRSGGSRRRPDGHRPPCRPPSPLIESGGRP